VLVLELVLDRGAGAIGFQAAPKNARVAGEGTMRTGRVRTHAVWAVVCAVAGLGCQFDFGGVREIDAGLVAPDAGDAAPPATDGPGPVADGPARDGAADGPRADGPPPADGPLRADAPPPVDAPPVCTGGASSCLGDELVTCSGGDWVDEEQCPLGCSASLGRCLEFDARNVPAGTLRDGTYDWVVDSDTTVDSDGTGLPYELDVTLEAQSGGALDLAVVHVRSLRVQPGVTLSLRGQNPIAIIAAESILVEGTIDASAILDAPGPGGYHGGGRWGDGHAPTGVEPARHGIHAGTADDSGGSGGCHGWVGGKGGLGGAAASPTQGAGYGSATGTPLFGGGGGAGGSGTSCGGPGGAGGGGLQLSAYAAVTVPAGGAVLAGGGGGQGGCVASNSGSGGGGGAGGAIVIEAAVVIVSGVVAANGGGGGGGAYAPDNRDGADGADGAGGTSSATGGASGRQSDPTYGGGGSGGASANLTALNGRDATGQNGNGGGGGGAAGRIVIASRSGNAPGGTVSPPAQTVTLTAH
jgi:hypothetical protein